MPNNFSHLFTANFADGSKIKQDDGDLSSFEVGRSAFYDVVKKSETIPLVSFYVVAVDGKDFYAVNAQNGQFLVNGARFHLYDGPPLQNFRIIYLRRHTHSISMGNGGGKTHTMTYRLGWQANDVDGKNYKVVIEFG